MAGHQPTLFHPGVWFKNFTLDRVANPRLPSSRRHSPQFTAVNLVIDNDVAASSSIRVPIIDPQTGVVRQEAVPFDSAAGGVPFEQNRIRNAAMFDSFDERLREAIHPIVQDPIVTQLWKYARAAASRCENVSCAIAHARHAFEGDLGLNTLELPLSIVCQSESFAAFTLTVLHDIERFQKIYNDSIRQYRAHHHIRSKAHPVPELGTTGDWFESPYWIYGDDSPQRKPLWIRQTGGVIELSDFKGKQVVLTCKPGKLSAAAELTSLSGPNWKLRPRALMTTMYARMILSDLFIHGIGGAKYDQLGDQIMSRFFGITAPEMMVVSATVQLPIRDMLPVAKTVAELRQRLRDIRWAPESFADEVSLPRELLTLKVDLLRRIPRDKAKSLWHEEVRNINVSLSETLADKKASLMQELADAKRQQVSRTLLNSREHSYCLFNADSLKNKFEAMLATD